MTLLPSETDDPLDPSIDGRLGPPLATPTFTETEDDGAATPSRAHRRRDYRLRGLDLGAQRVADVAPPLLPKHHPNRQRRRRLLVKWIVLLGVVTGVAALFRASVVEPFSVTSPSMVPTMQVGDRILVVKSKFVPGQLKVGDIVVFHQPQSARCGGAGGHSQDLVKRVIGVPGERIWSVADSIYLNGRILNEPGWYNPPYGHVGPTPIVATTIPSGQYFVMGDNRTDTCDSRSFGPISSSSIVGKVVATLLRSGHPNVHLL